MADIKSIGGGHPPTGAVRRPVAAAPTSTMAPKEVLGILRRGFWLMLILTLLGFFTGGTSYYLLRKYRPSYTAETLLEISPPVRQDPTIITSTQVNKDIQYGFRVSMANLLKQQGMLQDLLKRNDVQATAWFEQQGRDATEATKYLLKYLGAYAHRDADFVGVSMTCRSAREAAEIVNAMAELFVQSQGGQERDSIALKLSQLEERRVKVQKDIDDQNTALDQIRAKWGVEDVGTEVGSYRHQHPIVAEFSRLREEENRMLLDLQQLEAHIQNVQALATGPINEQIKRSIERDPIMITLGQQLSMEEANLSGKKSKFGPEHRIRKQIQERIDELHRERDRRQQEIAEQTRQADYMDAQQQLLVLQRRLSEVKVLRQEAEAKKEDMDLARIEFDKVQTVLDERIVVHNTIKEQIEKWRIKYDDPDTPKVKVKSFAMAPLEMDATRHWMVWLPSGTILGLLLGVSLAFVKEMMNDLLRSPSDVAKYLSIHLLGIIPDDTEDDLPRDVDLYQVVQEVPYSIVGEAYRRMRSNLELIQFKTLLVVGADPEDGATSSATNLALAWLAQNKRVLLVDGNFRQPYLRSVFPPQVQVGTGVTPQYGLSNVLMGQCEGVQAVRPSGIEGLDIIESGLLPPNPAELLGNARMQQLLDALKPNYDKIIIDTAPVLVVSDAKSLARLADATLMVFHVAGTRRGAAQRAIHEIRQVRGRVAGCVLFGARSLKGGYFREQFKSYRSYLQDQVE